MAALIVGVGECRGEQAPRLWMHAGWHMLLDDYLDRCLKAFQHNSLDGMDNLESALQEQLQSQVVIRRFNYTMCVSVYVCMCVSKCCRCAV